MTKLNLGGAWSKFDGFTSIDLRKTPNVDIVGDIRDLKKLGFEDNSVEEIVAFHSLEHIPFMETRKTIKQWYDIMKPGAKITIACPDLDYLYSALDSGEIDFDYFEQNLFGEFGGYWSMEQDWHHAAFTKKSMKKLLEEAGFKSISFKPPRNEDYKYEFVVEALK
ncbi:MAG TPA: methyltransferase domain-containing protein [Nitrosopumilus sp.]|nr:methyltransferase domain-containing protein [Nitrosopumilus sp.]